MIELSVLDLVPVREGGSVGEALTDAAALAQCAEAAGYKRFWVAEHHAMDGVAGGTSSVGGPEKVRADITRFIERTGADEIIVSGATFDPALRRRSLEITAKALA